MQNLIYRLPVIFLGLHELLGKQIPVGLNNLTWTLLKSNHSSDHKPDASDIENYSKLSIALHVMHECFQPVEEPRTKGDFLKDVIFRKRSELNRLNFRGFYTVLLQKDDEFITVATVRVYGEKVAEIPLVGTRVQYRRLGMCGILMNVLEKNLKDYSFLDFQDTVMCHKLLMKTPSADSSPLTEVQPMVQEDACGNGDNIDLKGPSPVSEVLQAHTTGAEIVEHGNSGGEGLINPVMNPGSDPGEVNLECFPLNVESKFKCYYKRRKRREFSACGS
ncbi:hypothetical protein RCOM_0623590 [Ricinus communis]|uniref:Increased DNA methylation 1 C-terminal domain-containing protein n=1 Tax=Ricinus communis TaxID=3988 RepID=B9STT0_RICCO|nr:hypothetical protein RCOM_0623590 [Ricinus communis]